MIELLWTNVTYVMCHRTVAWTSDVTYICAIGLRALRNFWYLCKMERYFRKFLLQANNYTIFFVPSSREARERARDGNEWRMIVTQF